MVKLNKQNEINTNYNSKNERTWNYRVLKKTLNESEMYEIHEVYYKGNVIHMWSENPISPYGENLRELKKDLQYQMEALKLPILEIKKLKNGKMKLVEVKKIIKNINKE